MSQQKAWDNEYANKTFITGNNVPQADFVRFIKWYKKGVRDIEGLRIIDLGCGVGKNAFYLAERGAWVTALDISKNAIDMAKSIAKDPKQTDPADAKQITWLHQSIADVIPNVPSGSIDIAIDVTSSNSLTEEELVRYIDELRRVLKPSSYLFMRGLLLEGDTHAKFLLKEHPGSEKNTYIQPATDIVERVFTKELFEETYGEFFTIVHFEKVEHYTTVEDRKYKRSYFVAYLQIKSTK